MSAFEELMAVAELSYDDFDQHTLNSGAQKLVDAGAEIAALKRHVTDHLEGQAQHALLRRLTELEQRTAQGVAGIRSVNAIYQVARSHMRWARDEFAKLDSAPLIDPGFVDFLYKHPYWILSGLVVSTAAYIDYVVDTNIQRREEAAQHVLTTMNSRVLQENNNLQGLQIHSSSVKPYTPVPLGSRSRLGGEDSLGLPVDSGQGSGSSSYVGGSGRSSDWGRVPSSSPGLPKQAVPHAHVSGLGQEADRAVFARPPASGPGSFREPISDPAQLAHIDPFTTPLNPKMSPDGRVTGHLPTPVDRYWDSPAPGRTGMGAFPLASGAVGVAAGAALTRSFHAGSKNSAFPQGSSSATRFGVSPSFSSGTAGASRSGHVLAQGRTFAHGSSFPQRQAPVTGSGIGAQVSRTHTPGSALSMNGTQGASPSLSGRLIPPHTTPNTTSANTGANGAHGGYYGAPHAGGGASDQRKDKPRLRGYSVVRVEEHEVTRADNSAEGFGAGDVTTVKPRAYHDNSDTWED